MALYFMDVRNISKAKQSAVAKAAYVSGSKIYSERDEETKRFRKREVEPVSFILAPAHAPEWVYDRERLWNEAEKIEKPVNARVQREVLVALPIELNKEQHIGLLKEYVEENFVTDGMVADVNIHYDRKDNPHAHILLTVRPFNEDGTWWKSKTKKEYLKDENDNFILDKNGKKKSRMLDLTGWYSKDLLISWRENLADKINQKYKEYGIDQSVTHLSYEETNEQKVARQRLPRNEFYIEEKEKKRALETGEEYIPVTTFGKLNLEIEKYNLEIEELNIEIGNLENEIVRNDKNQNNVLELKDYILEKRKALDNSITEEQSTAIKFVLSRSKSDVFNFNSIQIASNSVQAWGRTISKRKRELSTEKEFLNHLSDIAKNEPMKLKDIGIEVNSFAEKYEKMLNDFKNKQYKLSDEFEKYQVASMTIKVAKDLQFIHLKTLFDEMYPEHKLITRFKTDENMKVMDKYIKELFNNDLLKTVNEFEAYNELSEKEEHIFRAKTSNIIDDYKRFSSQYFGLDKRINLLEQQIKQINQNTNITYEKHLELQVMKDEHKHVKEQFEKAKTGMYDSLIELYGSEQKDVITKIPDKTKASILKDFIDNREVKDLSEHIRDEKTKWDKENPNSNEQQLQQNATGDLLSQLLAQSMLNQDKSRYDESNSKKRRKKGYSKGYTTKDYERGY